MRQSPFKSHAGWTADPPEQEYWLSYSDLMAGLLMMFVLMLVVAVYHYGSELRRRADELKGLTGQIEGTLSTIEVRNAMIDTLQKVLSNDSAQIITIDSVTGLIRLQDHILFAEGSYVLSQQGRAALTVFAVRYLPVVLGHQRYRSHLREIVVEGHTNDNGAYFSNLRLSQERAYAVMHFLLNAVDAAYQDDLRRFMTASGRSWAWVVCTDGETRFIRDPKCPAVDKERSRRIDIQFRLNDDEILREANGLLERGRSAL